MKTICQKDTNISLFLFEDDVKVTLYPEQISIGEPFNFIISDCNVSNVEVYFNVTNQENWIAHKYLHNGIEWSINPNFIPPLIREIIEISST